MWSSFCGHHIFCLLHYYQFHDCDQHVHCHYFGKFQSSTSRGRNWNSWRRFGNVLHQMGQVNTLLFAFCFAFILSYFILFYSILFYLFIFYLFIHSIHFLFIYLFYLFIFYFIFFILFYKECFIHFETWCKTFPNLLRLYSNFFLLVCLIKICQNLNIKNEFLYEVTWYRL